MRSIVWKNRANAILGLCVVILSIISLPNGLRMGLFALLGLLITIFGFAGSRLVEEVHEEKPSTRRSEPPPQSAPLA